MSKPEGWETSTERAILRIQRRVGKAQTKTVQWEKRGKGRLETCLGEMVRFG